MKIGSVDVKHEDWECRCMLHGLTNTNLENDDGLTLPPGWNPYGKS